MISAEAFMDIIALKRAGHSYRYIARKLGIHRKTVKTHLEANAFPSYNRSAQKPSVLEPFHQVIKGFLDEDDYQATWILKRLRNLGYAGSYRTLTGYVASIKEQKSQIAYLRFETEPGLQAQVDWGDFKVVDANGKTTTVYAFVMLLGYTESHPRVSSQLLVNFDRNRYSVNAMAVRKTVTVRAYADRVVVVWNDTVVGVHMRQLGRDKTIYDPWHYLAVLERKPGALRNGAPFKQWHLPEAMSDVRTALAGRLGGDREFVNILSVVGRYGLDPVAAACKRAITDKTISGDIILSILSRTHDDPQPEPAVTSAQLPVLKLSPVVDCFRYDRLLRGSYGTA